MANGSSSRAWSWLIAGLLVAALSVFGAIAGATVATRVFTTTGMGWDQLADLLGGMMLGGAAGLVAGVLAVWLLPRSMHVPLIVAALAATAACIVYVQATAPNVARPGDDRTAALSAPSESR